MHGVTSKVSNIIPRPSPFTTSSILFLAERFTSTSPSPQVAASRLEKALQKLEAVEHTVYEVKQELGTLQVKLAAAEQEVQQRMTLITAAKEKCVCIVYLSCSACICIILSCLCLEGIWLPAGGVSLLRRPLKQKPEMWSSSMQLLRRNLVRYVQYKVHNSWYIVCNLLVLYQLM